MEGAAFVVSGCALVTAGIAWLLDSGGISRRLHGTFIRSWRKIPPVGENWIESNPYQAYRWKVFLFGTLFGIILTAIGIRLIIG